ncbi:glycoside hydrolase superfamily, partial [Suillus subluteus]
FSNQYIGATNAGLIRGGYHFAHPDLSSGATHANCFLAHGGGWSAASDGITLPGALDIKCEPIEYYGHTVSSMVSCIKSFSDTWTATARHYLIIYTTTDWWTTCTGNSAAFGTTNLLRITIYSTSVGTLLVGWQYETFLQYADTSSGDTDLLNGDAAGLTR